MSGLGMFEGRWGGSGSYGLCGVMPVSMLGIRLWGCVGVVGGYNEEAVFGLSGW